MLGSEFNRHQASTSSKPSKTILRVMKAGKDSYPFSEFRGLGLPGLNIGQPGDIYIDITPGLHALYARYPESWYLWPGPNDASELLLHPLRSDRCLGCHATVGWFHPRHVRVNSANASELLSETLKCQEQLSEESKKRKRETLHQPIRTDLPSFTANTSSPSQNRNSIGNQCATDALPSLSSTTPYSQPAHEIMIPRTTDTSIIQNSDCTRSPTTADHRSIPTETDQMFTSDNLNERLKRNPQERYTSPKRIDLRKVAFGDAKLRPFAKFQKRRASSPTLTRSVSYLANEEQCLLQPSQPSIHDSETLRIFRNDDSPLDRPAQANSAAMFREPFVNNTGLQNFPVKPFSFDLSDITGGSFITKLLHYSASLASTYSDLPAEATERSHINNRLSLDIAIAELRKIKDASDANAAHLQEANDKIHHLEEENAKLRAQLLSQCRCNLPSSDIPLMTTNVEMPPATDSHALIDAEELSQIRRGSTSPLENVRRIPSSPQLYPRCDPCEEPESSLAPKHSATISASLLSTDTSMLTETKSSVHALSLTESATVECRNTIDIFKVEADTPSLDGCNSFESNMDTCSPLKDVNSWHASPAPTSTLLRMREIHRSVLFAKAGTLLICRICLGTKLGGMETVDQAFQTSEDSPELMEEHCEIEHPIDYEAVMNMSDEDLVDVVAMLSSEC